MSLRRLSSVASGFEPVAYALLRILIGALLFVHGAQKILGWFSTNPGPKVLSQLWVGGMIELVGGLLVALGLFTRPAAFLLSGTMAVAYLQFHWKLSLTGLQWLPHSNGGERALIYCFVFLFIAARGAGILSLDRARGRT